MPSDDPIIIDPPKVRPSTVSLKPQGLARLKDVVKSYSTWVLAVVLAGPDLYQGATSLGMLADDAMPPVVKWSVRALGGIGLLVKFISQRKPAA